MRRIGEHHSRSQGDGSPGTTLAWIKCLFIGALAVGISDFLFAYILFSLVRHRPALGVLQGPATGLLGPAAMRGGASTAALGTLIHFFIAFVWVAVFARVYSAFRSIQRLGRTSAGMITLSILAGLVVWLTMDWLVLRFSRAHYYALSEQHFWILLVGHIPFVGLPMVWSVRRFAPHQ